MKYIIYHSTASIYFRIEMLDEMMQQFKKNNRQNEITGILVYSEGYFLQLIEGDDKLVDNLMKKIAKHRFHHSIIILENAKINMRLFPNWNMGFEAVSASHFAAAQEMLKPVSAILDIEVYKTHPIVNYLKGFLPDGPNQHA